MKCSLISGNWCLIIPASILSFPLVALYVPTIRKLPASINEPPREKIQDATVSLASASDISIDSSVVAVLEPVGILTFRKPKHCFNSGKWHQQVVSGFRCLLTVTCDHPASLLVEHLSQNFHCFVASITSRRHINDEEMKRWYTAYLFII